MRISTKMVSTAKGRSGLMFFICALALLVFFSGTVSLGAHEAEGHIEGYNVEEHPYTATASDVDPADRESVYNFLLHVRAHFKDPPSLNILTALKELSSTEGGDWRNGTTYFIRVNDEAKVIYHAYYPVTQDGSLDGSSVVRNLVEVANKKEEGDCVPYSLDGVDRWACAAKFRSVGYNPGTNLVWIAGFHHDFEEVSFAKNTCPYYVPETSAIDVKDTKTLKKFVDEFAEHYRTQREIVGERITIVQRHCWRVLPWKYGPIYLFMIAHPSKRVIFNSNTPTIEGRTLYAEDENGCDSAEEMDRILAGEKRQCKSLGYLSEDDKKEAFFEYLWENPDVGGDEIDIDTECPNGPRTCAPGRSHKVGYFTTIESLQKEGETRIIGSGFYPETQEDRDDGDGCAIAGAGHKVQGAVLNLFLIVSVLFSAVWAGNRYEGRRTVRKKEGAGRSVFTGLFVSALALLVLFSWGSSAIAHEGHTYAVTAGEAGETDEGDMKEFVLHARAHWAGIETPGENIRFEQGLAEEGGDWNSGTVYLMAITEDGAILVHGEDPSAQNGTLRHYRTNENEFGGRESFLPREVQGLVDAAKGDEEGGCVRYGHEEEEGHGRRVACAVKFKHPVWNANSESSLILIAGYHHDHEEDEDAEISFAGIQCPYFAEVRNESPFFFQGTSANEVVDNETLKEFVDQFATHFEEQVNLAGRDLSGLAVIRNCWRVLPWKYEDSGTYIFIMTEDRLVFFNGLDPALENDTLNPEDENGCVIGDEIVNVVLGGPDARQCRHLGLLPESSEGFIEYLWDDPLNPNDDIDVCPDGPSTCSPGTTPKVSYLVPVDFLGQKFIIGSGYHPRNGGDDGDGCAVAGSGSGVRGAVFGLLLAVSVLFSVVFWRNRWT
ncbi:MAG: hypothetical protein OXK19_05345 [Candidatus Dadabacteria bacterium]|nr:hypothetical protein [Candidatus Dadabacteria bacterium]